MADDDRNAAVAVMIAANLLADLAAMPIGVFLRLDPYAPYLAVTGILLAQAGLLGLWAVGGPGRTVVRWPVSAFLLGLSWELACLGQFAYEKPSLPPNVLLLAAQIGIFVGAQIAHKIWLATGRQRISVLDLLPVRPRLRPQQVSLLGTIGYMAGVGVLAGLGRSIDFSFGEPFSYPLCGIVLLFCCAKLIMIVPVTILSLSPLNLGLKLLGIAGVVVLCIFFELIAVVLAIFLFTPSVRGPDLELLVVPLMDLMWPLFCLFCNLFVLWECDYWIGPAR
jgi:hypothetical protein